MKKIFFLLFLFQIISFSQSGWVEQVSGTTQNLTSIFFTDLNNGFIVGNAGTLLKTTDGGTTWILQSLGTTVNLKTISFIDSQNGYIFGPGQTFYKTTDGGNSWQNLSDSIKYSFAAISFLDLQNGIAIESTPYDTAIVYRTTDGGLSWNYLSKVTNENNYIRLVDIYYLDENTIVSAGFKAWSAVVHQSTDGGLTWSLRLIAGSSNGIAYTKSQFINSTTGFLLINSGQSSMYRSGIYKTSNSGTSWIQVDDGTLPLCRSIYMLDENNGSAVGNDQIYLGNAKPGAIYRTNSGGINWVKQISNTTTKLNDLYFIDLNTGIVIGDNGIILKTTNGGESNIFSNPIFPENNSTEVYLPIEFKWSSVPNLVRYELQVSKDLSFNTLVLSLINLTDTLYKNITLKNATKYYWRVKTVLSSGYENWSLVWNFTTTDSQCTLLSPPNNSTGLLFPIKFNWNSVPNALFYELQVSTNPDFNSSTQSFTDITDSSQNITSLINATQYYWRVKTIFNSGYGNWSPVWSFTTTDYPDILIAPENNAENIPRTVNLLWKKTPSALSYLVQVSLDSSFTDSVFSYNVQDTLKVLENLKSNERYFWKVQPILSGGNQGWSEIWSFRTMQQQLTFELYQNHPNPFNASTKIDYQLPVSGTVTLKVYDVLGNEIATLVNEEKPAGIYNVEFTNKNFSSGIYFYRLQAGSFVETKKMILLK